LLGLAADLRARRYSSVECVTRAIDDLERLVPEIGAVAALDRERSLAEARAADARLGNGTARRLEGVPIAVKDWIDVEGWIVTGATAAHGVPDRRPTRDATAVARLRGAGAVVVAITRALAENSVQGQTRNPRDPARAPGGSSSGSAAVVAAGAVPMALGSDSGGSIRLPAAWCGVAGLKPTFGRVSLAGHFPRVGALEDARTVIGPIARTVDDLAATLAVISGPDPLDPGTVPVPLGDPSAVDVTRLRVGVFDHTHTRTTAEALRRAGVVVVDEAVPNVCDEALALTRRYWTRAQASGREYVELLWDWDRFRRRMATMLGPFDVVLTPATDGPAPRWRESEDTDYQWLLPWSLTGAPAVVVGGLQVVGRPWEDDVALAFARLLEPPDAPSSL
jgi:amidase